MLSKQMIFRVGGDEKGEEPFNFNVHVACMDRAGKATRLPRAA
jgi:hypothetical protein